MNLNFETVLVAGFVLGVLSLVSILSAWIEGRRPYVALFAMSVSFVLFAVAGFKSNDGLQLRDIADAFVTVVARFIN